ncbi:MAG: hypothetical protein ABFE13_01570 [Phycisphaerales bacterium]
MPQKGNDAASPNRRFASGRFDGEGTAPRDACIFADRACVQFTAGGGEAEGRFQIEAYDGKVISGHWYWGNLAFDLNGLSFASDPLPVLDSHWTSSRIGFTTKQQIGKRVTFEGRFLSNPLATEIRRDMKDGFPMQASLSFDPQVIEQVSEGASVKVNGHVLKGPGAVFRKALIDEVSMCVFGAVPGTRSAAFADDDRRQVQFSVIKESSMANENPATALTAESLQTEHPVLFKAVRDTAFAEGQAAERDRFAALQKACGDDHALLAECFASPTMTTADALAKRTEKLTAENARLREQLAKPGSRAPGHGSPPDKATQEFLAQPAPQKAGEKAGPATFMEAVKAYQAEFKVTEGEAVSKCVDLYPDLHAKMQEGKSVDA